MDRNQDIVTRHVDGETLASVARDYGISRQRAQSIFSSMATDEQIARVTARREPKPRPASEPREPMVRVQIFLPSDLLTKFDAATQNRQAELRRLIADMPAGIADDGETDLSAKFWLMLPPALKAEFRKKCDRAGVSMNAAARQLMRGYLDSV